MVTKVKHCRICKSAKIKTFLDLGPLPLPNGFLTSNQLNTKEQLYPLTVGVCTNCWLMQLTDVIDPELMFRNYVYIPSATKTRLTNFSEIVSEMTTLLPASDGLLAIDIGSNDGSLLLEFKKRNVRTLGIDLAENLARIAELKGIKTLNQSFDTKTATNIHKRYGSAHYITATNVVAHIHNLHDFFDAVSLLLDSTGIFCCEFPYALDLLNKYLFDTIYQEHLSYFTVTPLYKIIREHKLKVIEIKKTPIDGGALRIFLTKENTPYLEDKKGLQELLDLEKTEKLNSFTTYKNFAKHIGKLRMEIRKTLKKLKSKHKTIAGYAAAARGNILMSYCGIGKREIDFVVDSTPYKQGLYTPGHQLPIFPEEEILKKKPNYVFILAWNFAEEIIEKQQEYRKKGGRFIIPVPYVKFI